MDSSLFFSLHHGLIVALAPKRYAGLLIHQVTSKAPGLDYTSSNEWYSLMAHLNVTALSYFCKHCYMLTLSFRTHLILKL